MVKIVHAADFHLDSPFAGLSPRGAAERREEQRLLLEDLARLVRAEQADALLLAGDILDGERVYRQTAQALARVLGELPCPVFLSPGNHDPLTPDSLYATMAWPDNVHIFGENWGKFSLPGKNCVVHGRGFVEKHRDTSPLWDFAGEEGDDTLEVICLHADLSPNSDYGPITREELEAAGVDYAALGHIHQYSGLCRAGGTAYAYPGCPQGRGFDELGEKGVLVVELSAAGVRERFVPLARRRYEDLTVDVTGTDPAAAISAALPDDPRRCICRVTLTGECSGVDRAGLEGAFAPSLGGLILRDRTRLPRDIWGRRGEDNLTGAVLDRLWQLCRTQPDNDTYQLAARFALAALEGGEDPAP